jgi:glycosyltransferase involved in cell wall biosynthesis
MRVGAGVQNKVLEYLALGLPTVTSSVGAEGIEVQDGVHLMIADKADRVAQLLIKIHETPQLAKSLSREGRELIGRAYRWNEVLQPLSNAVSAQVSVR